MPRDAEAMWDATKPLDLASWPRLRKLPPLTPAAPSLPPELIPESLQPWLVDVAERGQIPLAFVAAPAVVALASVIGRTVGIHPKQHDDWLVVPNLWGAVIGRPGLMKTPAITEAVKPLRRLAMEAAEVFKAEEADAQAGEQVLKLRIVALQDEVKQAIKKGDQDEVARKQTELAGLNAEQRDAAVHERRYIVNDSTVEKIGELLNQNPRGLLLIRDELSGWLRSLDKQGREGDREFYLEAWNGSGQFTYDRIGRGTLHIEAITLSILGTIQPGKLRSYVTSAVQSDAGDDGLLQRFQVVVWPDTHGEWENVDRRPNREARERAFSIFSALDHLDPVSMTDDHLVGGDAPDIPALHFAPDAQELFDEWRGKLEVRLRSAGMEATPAFESHLAKYRSLMPSLALIFHLVEVVSGHGDASVTLESARLAAAWCEFLEAHARKVYAPEIQGDAIAAHALIEKIDMGLIEDGCTVRDLYRPQWSGLSTPEQVMAGLELLQECGRVRIDKQETGGHPTTVVKLHPDLMKRIA